VHGERRILGETRFEQAEIALVIPGPVVTPEVADLRAVRHASSWFSSSMTITSLRFLPIVW